MRSAASPVHRHAFPQLVVDGLLVALAYFLAFWLRFEGTFRGRWGHLFEVTIVGVVVACLVALTAFGQYQRLWKFVGQRDYEAVLKAMVVATAVIVAVIALLHPVTAPTTQRVPFEKLVHGIYRLRHHNVPGPDATVPLPLGVIALFFLLSLGLLVGARFAVQLITDGRVRSPTVGKGARNILIVGGGEGGRLVVRELMRNPGLGLRPVGFLDDDPRLLGVKDEHGLKILGPHARARPLPRARRGRARGGRDRHSLGAGHSARPGGQGLP